ncbi:site-specific DNA-methyltransferase [Cytobacillus firmus]|uniref:site-specific DNA-methyltransferase n=1 Tax=Cytobacillus firmus TaxID=1399 RepID=UPI001C8EF981|nr:site-specific DNA-methyltransferase [Cytobacillus firmus]MBX9974197.1 site-specific DNA-methyltransferase [Cytobacillus firmus]
MIEQVQKDTANIIQNQLLELKKILPQVFTEGKIDWDKMKEYFGDHIETNTEKYSFNWFGKRKSIRTLETPSPFTIVPDEDNSINFHSTRNMFIEGDNLEALKLIYKSYFGEIKMIYIDPPYNKEKDFVYPDNYAQPLENYLQVTGQLDEEGNLLSNIIDKNGKKHSNWLSMMYPRLVISQQLLKDEGVIFISIDDKEYHNLRLLMNEIFGEENFMASFTWEGVLKNDSKFVSVSHDYILCYAKNKASLKENDKLWRTRKEGIDQIFEKVEELKQEHGQQYDLITDLLKEWYSSISKNEPAWQHRHYNHVDEKGVFFPGDISWPGGGGPTYDVIHPETKLPVKVPSRGWVYSKKEKMKEMINQGKVLFGADETTIPKLKRYLHETEGQVLPSVLYKDRRSSMKSFRELMGEDVFENPKDPEILAKLIEAATKESDIILDFFAGSGSTAQAVLELNKLDGENRRFICVQLPQPTPENSIARKSGYNTISEISIERIKRVINTLKTDYQDHEEVDMDLGVKVFKLKQSNFNSWSELESQNPDEYIEQMELLNEPLIDGWKEIDVIWEVLIKEGFKLTSQIDKVDKDIPNNVYKVIDQESNLPIYICLDDSINIETFNNLNIKGETIICRDSALTDELVANLTLQYNLKTI